MSRVVSTQIPIPVVYMRGGSSKALFFHDSDLPRPGPFRDLILKRAMGTPDPLQIDGMGGTKATTSKIAIVKASENEETDVDYEFAQVGTSNDYIDYSGNCGNISSAVGVFAIEEGLVKVSREGKRINEQIPTQEVRIYATGTKKGLISHVPVDGSGAPLVSGDFQIAGVPGSGAPILMDYRNTIGASLCRGILPTEHVIDIISLGDRSVEVTVCDVANLIVFVRAKDLGFKLSGLPDTSAASLTGNKRLIGEVREIRGKITHMLGLCSSWERVDNECPFIPMVCLIESIPSNNWPESDVSARLFLDNMCHESMAGTGAICLAACSTVFGSIVSQNMDRSISEHTGILRISHPRGVMPVYVESERLLEDEEASIPTFTTLSFVRTARRIMDGSVYIPKEFYTSQT